MVTTGKVLLEWSCHEAVEEILLSWRDRAGVSLLVQGLRVQEGLVGRTAFVSKPNLSPLTCR